MILLLVSLQEAREHRTKSFRRAWSAFPCYGHGDLPRRLTGVIRQ